MDQSLFILSPAKGHLGCVQILAIMNKMAVNISVWVLYQYNFPPPLGKCQGV